MRSRINSSLAIPAALFDVVAAPALAQSLELAPVAAGPMKSKLKTPSGGTVPVKVTNWRQAGLVELQVVESGSANWKKVLGALKAGQWTWANYRRPGIVTWICAGNTPTVSPLMCPMSMSARTRESTWSTSLPEALTIHVGRSPVPTSRASAVPQRRWPLRPLFPTRSQCSWNCSSMISSTSNSSLRTTLIMRMFASARLAALAQRCA
jgi:hypothetical protein